MRLNNVVIKPIVTEKTMALAADGRYVFKVNLKASKNAVAENVAEVYGVNVENVKTLIMPGKKRRISKTNKFTKTKKWKKAVVQLAKGESINLIEESK
ncbi:MAG: 50S ribosomal protein L23 [Patescibacteria group bacterium]